MSDLLRALICEDPQPETHWSPAINPRCNNLSAIIYFALRNRAERALLEVLTEFGASSELRAIGNGVCRFHLIDADDPRAARLLYIKYGSASELPVGSFLALCEWKEPAPFMMKGVRMNQQWGFHWIAAERRWRMMQGEAWKATI